MKKTTLSVLLFLSMLITLSAQVSLDPAVQTVIGDPVSVDIEAPFNVMNGPDVDRNLLWALEKTSNWPVNWDVWVCDFNLCYTPSVMVAPEGRANAIGTRESQKWSLHCNPYEEMDLGTVLLHIIEESTGDTVTTLEVTFDTRGPTSTILTEVAPELSIYPNPATSYFMIDNDEAVSDITVYNIVGKELYTAQHTVGRQYDVTDLRTGIYLVRMVNKRGDVIKSSRLSKR